MPRRSSHKSPWHLCGICNKKTHLDSMIRQRGILRCQRASCFDTSLIGERDVAIARAIERLSSSDNNELSPDPRLSDQAAASDEDILF